jgi:flagellar export protein FliJ
VKRFRFRFQPILTVKERLEEARRASLGEAVAVLNYERERLADLQRVRDTYRRASATPAVARLDTTVLGLGAGYLQRLRGEIGAQEQRIRQVEAVVEERRQRLALAARERRTYEILRDQARARHRDEQLQGERRVLDEIGEQLHQRQRREAAGADEALPRAAVGRLSTPMNPTQGG